MFKEIIFPQKIKIEKTSVEKQTLNLMFETVFCKKYNTWVSMVRCVNCPISERTLEDILIDGEGCNG